MPSGGKRVPKEGKKLGRPEKPKIEQSATKGIASEVLAMSGPPPDHVRNCVCSICKGHPKNCTCVEQCGDCGKLEDNCGCETYRAVNIACSNCRTFEDHKECHCERCGWWELLLSRDRRIVHDTRKYLTDRRDGKPAQGVFIGDTREAMQPLTRGNLPSHFNAAGAHSAGSHKPN